MREVKPTQKPVPSSDIKDLFFNSGLLDIWATSLERKYIDRFGNCHLTAAGMEWLFKELVETFKVDMNIAIVAAGYITIDSFQQGADLPNNELTQRNHILRDETTGEYYRWDGDLPKKVPAGSTPQSTGGIGKGAWVGVGDASLRGDLNKNTGANLIKTESGNSVQDELNTVVGFQKLRNEGFVEGWRNEYPDDTDCIDAALSESSVIVKLEAGRVYNIRGGVLYSRKYQTWDFNGGTVRLMDNAGDFRKNLIEMDDYSSICNGVIDGNYQNNVSEIPLVGIFERDVPFCHNLYESRLHTNNNKYKKVLGASIDKIVSINAIRSNFVLSGANSNHGLIEARDSFSDHHVYISGSDNQRISMIIASGKARVQSISLGTDANTIAGKTDIGTIKSSQLVAAPFISTDAAGGGVTPAPLQGRDSSSKLSEFTCSQFNWETTETDDPTHRLSFFTGWNAVISMCNITLSDTSTNGRLIESRGDLKISSLDVAVKKNTKSNFSVLFSQNGGKISVQSYAFSSSAELNSDFLHMLGYSNGYISISNMIGNLKNSKLFNIQTSTSRGVTLNIQSHQIENWNKDYGTSISSSSGVNDISIQCNRTVKAIGALDNLTVPDIAFCRVLDLASSTGYLSRLRTAESTGGFVGQELIIIGNGVTQLRDDANSMQHIRFKNNGYKTLNNRELLKLALTDEGIWREV